MSNKQSSVDFLEERIKLTNKEVYAELFEDIEQAKAMHKEEIENAHIEGKINGMDISHPLSLTKEIPAEQYYNETFGGNNE